MHSFSLCFISSRRPPQVDCKRTLIALSVEDAGGQAEQRVDVALLEQVRADGLSGSALEEDVVGDDDRSSAVDFQQRLDVLDEIELFVLGAL